MDKYSGLQIRKCSFQWVRLRKVLWRKWHVGPFELRVDTVSTDGGHERG